jgi:hypothetical protein
MRVLVYIILFLVTFSVRIGPQEIPFIYPTDEFPISGWEGGSVHSWCESGGEIFLQGLGERDAHCEIVRRRPCPGAFRP